MHRIMRYISLKVLFISCLVGFGLISCGGSGGSGGSGKKDENSGTPNPYTCVDNTYTAVYDVDTLKAMSMNGNYCLHQDIDLVEVIDGFPLGWGDGSLGGGAKVLAPFTGSFDGQGNTISNLVIFDDTSNDLGLFAKIGGTTSSDIKDLTLDKFKIKGVSNIGALAGSAVGEVNIINVKVTGVASEAKATDNGYVGGLTGKFEGGTITGSSVTGTVKSAGANVGGLVGSLIGTLIFHSHSEAAVTGANGNFVGGLIGYVDNSADTTLLINDSYATGAVSGGNYVGGLVGQLKGKIVDSYAAGAVTATTGEAGGLVGRLESGSVSNAYAIGVVSGTTKGGLIGKLEGAVRVTNSYFDLEATTTTKAIGNKGTATITLHTGVDGKGDIKGNGATPAVYKTVDDPQSLIFKGWDEANWTFADGQWPILEHQGDLSAGTVKRYVADNPYTCPTDPVGYVAVHDVTTLKDIGYNMAGNYCLHQNIDLSGVASGFPLGGHTSFTGTFDGKGNTISNLVINRSNGNDVGLFPSIRGTVKDLNLNNFKITGRDHVGALAGTVFANGKISKVKTNNAVISGRNKIGGLIGRFNDRNNRVSDSAVIGGTVDGSREYGGGNVGGMIGIVNGTGSGKVPTIVNSHATSAVSGYSNIGGLVGIIIQKGKISDSYATGAVTGSQENIGGLLGKFHEKRGVITFSYATGAVRGKYNVGGLVGMMNYGGEVSESYATGAVNGNSGTGGLVGKLTHIGKVKNSYATGRVTSGARKGGLIGNLYYCTVLKCSITNSHFDNSVNRGMRHFGEYTDKALVKGLETVNGASDIGGAGSNFYRNSSRGTRIFVNWNTRKWNIKAGKWPTFKP